MVRGMAGSGEDAGDSLGDICMFSGGLEAVSGSLTWTGLAMGAVGPAGGNMEVE